MRAPIFLPLLLSFTAIALQAVDIHPVTAKNGAPPVGPYSPAVFSGDYLYVSGQGAKDGSGKLPDGFEAQARQTLENVKGLVEAAGLGMQNVVYTQMYLDDMSHLEIADKIYKEYFPQRPPARAVLGVAKLPGTPIEINAVAVKDAGEIKAVTLAGHTTDEAVTPGILTKERLFISGMPAKDTDEALDSFSAIVKAAGLSMGNVVFVNPYLTDSVSMKAMNTAYAKRFEFGNTPGRATIQVSSLPGGAGIEFTGVAARSLKERRAIRPKNMEPSPTASPCVFAGDTLYCSAKGGFIPGMNGGIFAETVENQLRQTMRNLLDNLEEAGMTFNDVVATNVYLDDLTDFAAMNKQYAKYFKGIYPARTTVQQIAPAARQKQADDTFPELEQISIVAVKH